MDTQATTTMSTKRSRRRTARGTRARRVVRDAGLTALIPAKGGIEQQPRLRKGVAARQASARVARGDERRRRGAAKDAGAAAGNLNAPALYRLMAWLSPAYPIGAFSYSSGIEWAVEAGDVTDAATLERWLAVMIADGGGFCDAVFFVHAHRAVSERNDEALLAALEPVVAATAARALATALDDVGGAAFRADLASMRHETQHTRLFRS
jgi:urease accessory protein